MNSILLGALTALPLFFPTPGPRAHRHDDAERDWRPAYVSQATGRLAPGRRGTYRWPVTVLSIGHSTVSYQKYTRDDEERPPTGAYFHGGLDIRADAGSDVIASAGGKVINIENYVPGNAAYWEVAILDDEGFLWQYHHVDRRSIPAEIHEAFKSGGRIATGTKIGEVYYWNISTFGERYHHIHLNVLGADKEVLTAFSFLEPLDDKDPPKIGGLGLLKNGSAVTGVTVNGTYSLFAEITDLILHGKFIVPPHSVTMEIDGAPSQEVWVFDRLPGKDVTDFVSSFFVPKLTCGNYDCRKIFINLGFTTDGHAVFPTRSGTHEVVVTAADFVGNTVSKGFRWEVR